MTNLQANKEEVLTLVGVVVDGWVGRLERPILGLPPLSRVELALSPDLLYRRGLLVAAVVVEAVVSWQENFVKN